MSSVIVVYASTARGYPEWLDKLPEHTRVRSPAGLDAALTIGARRSGTRVCLLVPRDAADLAELAASPKRFHGWKVVIELPEETPEALKLARPLAPRFFSFRNESQEYLVAVVSWIASHATVVPAISDKPDSSQSNCN